MTNDMLVVQSWATKYRPRLFSALAGQENVVARLRGMIKQRKLPPTILFTGPAGSGKTTCARMFARYINCETGKACGKCPSCQHLPDNHPDIIELNAADARGIDEVRKLIQQSTFMPRYNVRCFILDECFISTTLVRTSLGEMYIKDINEGQSVYNKDGIVLVTKTFKTKVSLDRLVCVRLDSDISIFCSSDHVFYTQDLREIKACDLKGEFLYDKMPIMWKEVRTSSFECSTLRALQNTTQNKLRELWGTLFTQGCKVRSVLFSILCWSMAKSTIEFSREGLQSCGKEEDRQRYQRFLFAKSRKGKEYFNTDVFEQSDVRSCGKKKGKSIIERKTLFRSSGWKWKTLTFTSTSVIKTLSTVGHRISNFIRGEISWLSDQLQSRYSFCEIDGSGGNRRSFTQWHIAQETRSKKGSNVENTRVESVTFYKCGRNDELFNCCIGDQERNQGYAYLYDLEVKGHHSYYANGVLVHNCHQLTPQSIQALLKPLEEPSLRTLWLLCTTDPQKFPESILSRAQRLELVIPSKEDVAKRLSVVAEKEKIEFPDGVIERAAEYSGGRMRFAITLLEGAAQYLVDDPKADAKTIMKKVAATMEPEYSAIATKIMLGLYLNRKKVVASAIYDLTTPAIELVNALLRMSEYRIGITVNSESRNIWHSPDLKKFKAACDAKAPDTTLDRMLEIEKILATLRAELQQFAVPERSALLSHLTR